MNKQIFIAGNPRKTDISKHLKRVIEWAGMNQIGLSVDASLKEPLKSNYPDLNYINLKSISSETDMVLTFGGDGTILYTANQIVEKEIPILGLNLGGLGFLADINVDELINAMEFILHNEYNIEYRNILQIHAEASGETRYAINDVVFDKAGFQRVIEIQVYLDNTFINGYIADGLIISTPTGSTGYNLSSGGPIVLPGTGVNIINPICPHSLTARPLVVPANKEITVHVNTEFDHFICHTDGQEFGTFKTGSSFKIRTAPYQLKLIKLPERDFFKTIRDKLRWGHDFRNKKRWSYGS
ncbi:MAG: NAD(+)/NADH kinase [Calditrichaeota bacterium]|nr:NAD(+)/NADH kinase [Calditrichota bacterium]